MNVLEVCFSPSLGGLELYCLKTARQLMQRGHKVLVWLAEGSRMLGHPLVEELDVQVFPEPGYLNPLFWRKAKNILRSNAIEVVHLHRGRDLASFAWFKKIPRVLTLQIESTYPKRDLYHRFVYSRVDRVLTITERMRELALQALPVKPEQVFCLHYGVDADGLRERSGDPAAFRREYGIPENALLIGLVGRLESSKGQDVLLKAFAKICHEYPDLHVLLAGEPPPEAGDYDRKLRDLAQKLNIFDRVHFVGFQVNTPPVYAALDVCVLASRKESFGLVLLEAMAMGVPLIATAAGGVPEIVKNGENGLLIPPEEPDALARALKRLIGDPNLCNKLSKGGQNAVAGKFSLDKHLEALEGHFNEVIQARRRI